MKGMYMDRTILRNVQGQNITKLKAVQTIEKFVQIVCKLRTNCVLTMCKLYANCEQAVCKLCAIGTHRQKKLSVAFLELLS